MDVPAQVKSKSTLLQPFGSAQALNGLDDAHSCRRAPSSLLSPLAQGSISSESPAQTQPEVTFTAVGASLSPGKLTHKINHHAGFHSSHIW